MLILIMVLRWMLASVLLLAFDLTLVLVFGSVLVVLLNWIVPCWLLFLRLLDPGLHSVSVHFRKHVLDRCQVRLSIATRKAPDEVLVFVKRHGNWVGLRNWYRMSSRYWCIVD